MCGNIVFLIRRRRTHKELRQMALALLCSNSRPREEVCGPNPRQPARHQVQDPLQQIPLHLRLQRRREGRKTQTGAPS